MDSTDPSGAPPRPVTVLAVPDRDREGSSAGSPLYMLPFQVEEIVRETFGDGRIYVRWLQHAEAPDQWLHMVMFTTDRPIG